MDRSPWDHLRAICSNLHLTHPLLLKLGLYPFVLVCMVPYWVYFSSFNDRVLILSKDLKASSFKGHQTGPNKLDQALTIAFCLCLLNMDQNYKFHLWNVFHHIKRTVLSGYHKHLKVFQLTALVQMGGKWDSFLPACTATSHSTNFFSIRQERINKQLKLLLFIFHVY